MWLKNLSSTGSWQLFAVLLGIVWSGCSTSAINPGENPYVDTSNGDTDTDTDTDADTDADADTDSDSDPLSCLDENPCAATGTCLVVDGRKFCECDSGWAGETCDECAAGWHAQGAYCVLDQQCLSTSCAGREVYNGCQVVDGTVVCTCSGNWDDATNCLECESGFHEVDGYCGADMFCVGNYPCEHGGSCSSDDGVVSCDCSTAGSLFLGTDNWEGEYCEICPEGYYEDGDDCVAVESCLSDQCGDHGTCVETANGPTACICDSGWDGEACEDCASGYHESADGTECVLDEICATDTCGSGNCEENAEGGVTCTCPVGAHLDANSFCSECVSGYHFFEEVCVADEPDCETLDPCAEHGTCVYEGGVKRCDCEPLYAGLFCEQCMEGYQDNDDNGDCLPSCETAVANGLDCGDNGACEESSGATVCDCAGNWSGALCDVCPPGYHVDATSDCVENEICESDTCNGHGTCSVPADTGLTECVCDAGWMNDAGGNACTVCAPGYQNTYVVDDCLPTCATAVAAGLNCGDHGTCALNTTTGIAYCACDTGWGESGCSVCETGYHAVADSCVMNEPSCSELDPCGDYGTCVYSGGVKSCLCAPLYTGTTCEDCVTGYQDTNGDGVCRPTCATAESNGLDCGDHGTCDVGVIDGLAACVCDDEYDGADCSVCASGYHFELGVCSADEVCADAVGPCVNGSCAVVGGVIDCTCDVGYAEDADGYCTQCAVGYHDNGGVCDVDEQCQTNSCNGNGTCTIVNGLISCSCNPGFTAVSYCAECTTGFHPSGGTCVLNQTCGLNSCSGHGTCDDSTYVVVCTCDDGWDGTICNECATGYHDDSGDCVLNESCIASSCSFSGSCSDTGGVVSCSCYTGYDGDYCELCAIDYHFDFGTGECVEDDACEQLGVNSSDCNFNGTCDDSTGVVKCSCNAGWAGNFCSVCANGFYMESGNCLPDVDCTASSCANGGTCVDDGASIHCECPVQWDPATFCATCAAGYHESGSECVEDDVCDVNSCNGNGDCSIVDGVVDCACYAGYSGDYCAGCDVAGGYSTCGSVCCGTDETCYNNACVTPLTCDDLDTDNFTECGPTAFDDGAGGTIDCGDCGTHGTCSAGVCDCNDNYGVLEGGHECVYACSGYLPSVGCCEGAWVVYCNAGTVETYYCGFGAAPNDVCGWTSDFNIFSCDDTAPPPEYSITCPSNIVVDTEVPACVDDAYEENDIETDAYELVVGAGISATFCVGEVDIYKIYLSSGESVDIVLNYSSVAIDLDMMLWYSMIDKSTWSTLVTYANDSSVDPDEEVITFAAGDEYPYFSGTFTGEGYYFIEIGIISGDSSGYTLTVTPSD
ncbi:MAG: PPC domain-containing protein [Deltaproteobacteria bacterium]|nr:PPC domain-containing protein [Deltaproteobacteria bacterium]MBN2672943.1 PPC domain-containing protein [Deltaproteobacteria bacterium]